MIVHFPAITIRRYVIMATRYTLVDDIEYSNYCILVKGNICGKSILSTDNSNNNQSTTSDVTYTLYRITSFAHLVEHVNGKYGTDMYTYIRTLYSAYDDFAKLLIMNSNTSNDVQFYIAHVNHGINGKIQYKYLTSSNYKYAFNCVNGVFLRWGDKVSSNPRMAPMGPEIADIEISTICNGLDGVGPCKWCYKSNTGNGHNMTIDSYKKYLDVLNQNGTLLQVALGIGDIDGNEDMFAIMRYTRDCGIIPNVTINGARMNNQYYESLAKVCGAVSVSHYTDDVCFNAVDNLSRFLRKNNEGYTIDAVNIHQLLSDDTYEDCMALIDKYHSDKRLSKLNAIVFLTLKPIGKRNNLHCITNRDYYNRIIEHAISNDVPIGFDSCGCYNFLDAVKEHHNYGSYQTVAESCESSLFSIYVNSKGIVSPCSFTEHIDSTLLSNLDAMNDIIDLNECNDLLMDVWYSRKFNAFRRALLSTENNELQCRYCPAYDLNLKTGGKK